MSSNYNDRKVLKIFTISIIGAIFSASLSQAVAVQAQTTSELNIEDRLARVREQLKQQSARIKYESANLSPTLNNLRTEKNRTLQAQWNNYWNDWCDSSWCDWSDTSSSDSSQQT